MGPAGSCRRCLPKIFISLPTSRMKKNICLEVSQSVFTLASAGGSHRAASQQLQVLIVYFLHPTDLHYFQHDFVSL